MGNRARDEVIYTRVDHTLMREFEKQKSESGYKSNADFIDYLLRVNRGKQIDGVTLKEFTEVMNDVSYELKKQGVNINQMARNINAYPDLASRTSFDFYQRKYQQLENTVLRLYEKVVS